MMDFIWAETRSTNNKILSKP